MIAEHMPLENSGDYHMEEANLSGVHLYNAYLLGCRPAGAIGTSIEGLAQAKFCLYSNVL
jgi:hypothetical protein